MKPILVAVALAMTMIAGRSSHAYTAGEPQATGADARRVWLKTGPVPIGEALGALTRATGLHVEWMHTPGDELVDVDLAGVPLARALDELLGHRNFVAMVPRSGVAKVIIGSTIAARSSRSAPPEAPAAITFTLHDTGAIAPPLVTTGVPSADSDGRDALADSIVSGASAEVRVDAIRALGRIEPVRVDVLLAAATNDPSARVRRAALDILTEVGSDAVMQPVLEQIARHDASRSLRRLAAAELRANPSERPASTPGRERPPTSPRRELSCHP